MEGGNSWNLNGVDMTIRHSEEIFERIQLVIKAYDCEFMQCRICKLSPVCEKKAEKEVKQ